MQRKALGIIVACLVLLAAIVAGYWDMLESERSRLKSLAQTALDSVGPDNAPDRGETGAEVNALSGDPADGPAGLAADEDPAADSVVDDDATATAETDAAETTGVALAPETSEAGDSAIASERAADTERDFQPGSQSADAGDEAASASTSDGPGESDAASMPAEGEVPDETAATTSSSETPSPETSSETGADIAALSPSTEAGRSPVSESEATADGPAETPRFDILRVEPDGSMVVAGNGPADATVSLIDGDETLGSDRSGPGGDFVIVLDDGLAPGSHAIKLVAELEDGEQVTSEETAVIDMPEAGRGEELLALVEAPDAASRLIEIPNASTASEGPGAQSAHFAPSDETQLAAAEAEPTGPDADAPDGGDSAADLPATGQPEETTDTGSDTPQIAMTPESDARRAADTQNGTDADSAMRTLDRDAETAQPGDEDIVMLRVDAVEVEGDRIYVAGSAPSGSIVRVYLNNLLLDEDRVGSQTRFLTEASTRVPFGDNMVRADQVDGGGNVVARVEVPFARPEGSDVAAVARTRDLPNADDAGSEAAGSTDTDRSAALASRADETAADGAGAAQEGTVNVTERSEITDGVANDDGGDGSTANILPDNGSEDADSVSETETEAGQNVATAPQQASSDETPSAGPEAASPSPAPQSSDDGNASEGTDGTGATDSASVTASSDGGTTTGSQPAPGIAESSASSETGVSDDDAASRAGPALTETTSGEPQRRAAETDPVSVEDGSSEEAAASSRAPSETAARAETPDEGREDIEDIAAASDRPADAAAPAASPSGETPDGTRQSDRTPSAPSPAPAAASDPAGGTGESTDNADAETLLSDSETRSSDAETETPENAEPRDTDGNEEVAGLVDVPDGGDLSETETIGSDGIRTRVQAPLVTAPGRVIIRKGDTLWRISRESYGAGARYTVIYLANGDQIRDPHRIFPGQVFRMPDQSTLQEEEESALD